MANFANGGASGGGAPGAPGVDGDFIYTAFASTDTGTGFSSTPSGSLKYRAEKRSATEIVTPVVGDFSGLWVKYIGEDGADGADGDFGYSAFASTDTGTGFSLTPSGSLKYRAEIRSPVEIIAPVLGDFAGATWVKYIGEDGANGTNGTNGTSGTDGLDGSNGTDGKKGGYDYKFSTSIVAGNPSAGFVRLDTVDTAFTALRINQVTVLNINQDLMLATRAAGDSVVIRSQSLTGTTFLQAIITSKPTDAGSYWTLPVAYVAGAVPIVDEETIAIEFSTQGQKAGTRYDFDTGTTGTSLATGTFRINNANANASTALYVHETAFGGTSMVGWLDTIIKSGHIEIKANGNNQANIIKYKISAAFTDVGTYRSIPITYLAGGNFTAGDQCVINYTPSPNVNWDGTNLNDETGAPIDTPLAFNTFAAALTATAATYVGKTAQCLNPGNNVVVANDRRTVRGRPALIFSNPDSGRWECADGEMLLVRDAPAIVSGAIAFDVTCPAATWVGTYTFATANGGLETKVTSAGAGAHGLSATNLGAMIEVTAGTGWTPGLYKLTVIEAAGDELTIDHPYAGGLGQPTFTLINGSSAEIVLKRIKIPALSVDGGIRWNCTFDCTGVTSKRPRVRYGAAGVAVASAVEYFNMTTDTAGNTETFNGGFDNRGVTDSQIAQHSFASSSGTGTSANSPTVSTIESNVPTDFLITAHISLAGDMIQISRFAVWVTI